MTVGFDTKYPPEAVNAAWQKKKSFMDKAKSKTKTGLGESLVKAEAEWKKINFDSLDADKVKLNKYTNLEVLLAAKARAERTLAEQVKTTMKAVSAAADRAEEASKNKALTKEASAAAGVIHKKLEALYDHLKGIKLDDFAALVGPATEHMKAVNTHARQSVEALTKALDEVEKNPTRSRWEQGDVLQGFRDVQSAVRGIPSLKEKYGADWEKLDGLQHTRIRELQALPGKLDKETEKTLILKLVREANLKLNDIRGYTNTHR